MSLAVLPFAILAAAHWATLPFPEAGDYAQYLSHAKALVEGRPYGDIGYLYTPFNIMIGPRVQPPGWPLMLAPGVALFGTGLLFPKILVTLCMAAFLVAVAVRLGRHDARWIALASAGAAGAGLEASFATNSALSDLPFLALLWGLVLIGDIDRPLSWRRTLAIFAVGSFMMSVRIIGVAIVPAVLLLAIARPRDRMKLLIIGMTWVALALIALLAVGFENVPFLRHALRGPAVIFGRFMSAFTTYRFGLLESLLYPTPWDLVNDAWHAAGLLLLPIGAWDFVKRYGRSLLGCVAVCYVLVMVSAPVADPRYLWPLWPVVAYTLLAGARRVVGWVPRWSGSLQRALPWGAAAIIAGTVVTAQRNPGRGEMLTRSDVTSLFEWVRTENAREPMRAFFIAPRLLTLETGVPAMGFFRAQPQQVTSEFQRVGITHVIMGDVGLKHPPIEGLRALMSERPQSFDQVYQTGDFTVYRVRDL